MLDIYSGKTSHHCCISYIFSPFIKLFPASIQSPTSYEDSIPITSPIIFKKPLLPRLKMTTMGEPAFGGGHSVPHSAGHSNARTPDVPWTPYSAVCSFYYQKLVGSNSKYRFHHLIFLPITIHL